MKLPIFTEDEFVKLLETGEVPERFKNRDHIVRDISIDRRDSQNDEIGLDDLAKEYLLCIMWSIFGQSRIPKRHRAGIVYSLLKSAEVQGLIVENEPVDGRRYFSSTRRLEKYWSLLSGGGPLPPPDKLSMQ